MQIKNDTYQHLFPYFSMARQASKQMMNELNLFKQSLGWLNGCIQDKRYIFNGCLFAFVV